MHEGFPIKCKKMELLQRKLEGCQIFGFVLLACWGGLSTYNKTKIWETQHLQQTSILFNNAQADPTIISK